MSLSPTWWRDTAQRRKFDGKKCYRQVLMLIPNPTNWIDYFVSHDQLIAWNIDQFEKLRCCHRPTWFLLFYVVCQSLEMLVTKRKRKSNTDWTMNSPRKPKGNTHFKVWLAVISFTYTAFQIMAAIEWSPNGSPIHQPNPSIVQRQISFVWCENVEVALNSIVDSVFLSLFREWGENRCSVLGIKSIPT